MHLTCVVNTKKSQFVPQKSLLNVRNLGNITQNGMPVLEPEVAKRMHVVPMRMRITYQITNRGQFHRAAKQLTRNIA